MFKLTSESLKRLLILSGTLLSVQSGCVNGEPCEDESCEESCDADDCDEDARDALDEGGEADAPTVEAQGITYVTRYYYCGRVADGAVYVLSTTNASDATDSPGLHYQFMDRRIAGGGCFVI